jgi:serine/threonine protein kinase
MSADQTGPQRVLVGSPAAPALCPSPLIPDYELVQCIGRGSYGEVWLARNALGALRAAKIVSRKFFDHDKPYEREFEGLKKFESISHARENQVDIYHVGRNDTAAFFYYVMELADRAEKEPVRNEHLMADGADVDYGYTPRTLKHDLRTRGSLPVGECVQIAISLARALEHLHANGLVHRDVKPSNIIFVCGIAKLADIGLVSGIDATRSFVGTEGYIPPEGPGTPQSDLYSLGKVLYESITGNDRLDFPELPRSITV